MTCQVSLVKLVSSSTHAHLSNKLENVIYGAAITIFTLYNQNNLV